MGLTRITSDGITDGSIVNADINGSAAIAGSKLNTNFGSSGMTATGSCSFGNITISNVAPKIFLTDSDTDSDFSIRNMHGVFGIHDQTNSADRLTITSDGHIRIPTDNQQLQIGASADLQIYHDGTTNYLRTENGSINVIKSNTENIAKFIPDGAVELYYDNSKKFETTAAGVKLGDNLKVEFGDDDDLEIYYHSSTDKNIINSLAPLRLLSDGNTTIESTSGEVMIKAVPDGGVQLYYDNSNMLETINGGARVNGVLHVTSHLDMNDNDIIKLGDDDDLQIYHSGSDSYIDNDTGRLLINTASGEVQINKATSEYMARFIADGAVELYHDNSKKFETTSTGVSVTGKATFPDGNSNGIVIGNSGDYRLFHNGSNSYIENDTGNFIIDNGSAGDVYINAGDDIFIRPQGSEDGIKVIGNAGVQLFYDNSKKLETISTGANITGKLGFNTTSPTSLIDARDTTGATIQCSNTSSNIGKIGINVGTNENFVFSRGASSSDRRQLTFMLGNNTCAKFDTNLNFIPASDSTHDFGANTVRWRNLYADTLYGDGSNLTGISTDLVGDTSPQLGGDLDTNSHHILIDDDHEVKWGNDSDLRIFHANGNANFIQSYNNHNLRISAFGTGRIKLQTNEGEDGVVCIPNAATELYYDNSKKLHTTSAGAQCTGSLTLTEHLVVGDNKELKLGASSDMTIWHSGSDFNMYNSTGELIISNASGTGTGEGAIIFKTGNNNTRAYLSKNGHFYPAANNSFDLGTNTNRWRNIYTNDLHLSNVGHSNEIDGTWGDWTIQEGESDLFLKNNRSGKKYKFNLMEVS